jgi:Fur family peroxide stress response transcriptional regulator
MNNQNLISLFRENGYKVTAQRLAICKYILSRKDHPAAEKIFQEMKEEYPTISLGTIYKTLHLLKELGLIQELGFNEGSIRYDPDMELHINMVCSNCGKIYDYKSKNLKNFWQNAIKEIGVNPTGQRIDLYFKCDKCD